MTELGRKCFPRVTAQIPGGGSPGCRTLSFTAGWHLPCKSPSTRLPSARALVGLGVHRMEVGANVIRTGGSRGSCSPRRGCGPASRGPRARLPLGTLTSRHQRFPLAPGGSLIPLSQAPGPACAATSCMPGSTRALTDDGATLRPGSRTPSAPSPRAPAEELFHRRVPGSPAFQTRAH